MDLEVDEVVPKFTNHNVEETVESVILRHFCDVVFVEGDSPVRRGPTVITYITAKAGHQDQVRDALLDLLAQRAQPTRVVS